MDMSPTNHSMRRRQVDIDKPLQVIWMKNNDIKKQAKTIQEALQPGLSKPLTTEVIRQNHHILELQTCKVSLKASIGEVITPGVRTISSPQSPKTFVRPVSYIHFYEPPYDFEEITYELDDQDDDFLLLWNQSVNKEQSLFISEEKLEEIFTLLENLTFQNYDKLPSSRKMCNGNTEGVYKQDLLDFQNCIRAATFKSISTRKELEKLHEEFVNLQELHCQACCRIKENAMGVIDNIYIRCSVCSAVCHRSCYYKETVSHTKDSNSKTHVVENDWICDKCSSIDNGEEEDPSCVMCYHKEGLLRYVVDEDNEFGSFSHLVCAKWVEETFSRSFEHGGKINGIRNIPEERWDAFCKYCGESGVCIQCTASHCRYLYHPYCAQQAKCYMENTSKIFYCTKHTEEIREDVELKNSMLSLEHLELIAPVVKKKAREILELPSDPHSIVFEALFYYWKCKRFKVRSFLIDPLNRMLEEDKEIANRTKKSKKKRGTEQESLESIICIRKDLEYARMLLDMVRRREVKKLEWLEHSKRESEIHFRQVECVDASTEEDEELEYSEDLFVGSLGTSSPSIETEDEEDIELSDSLPVPVFSPIRTSLHKRAGSRLENKNIKKIKTHHTR